MVSFVRKNKDPYSWSYHNDILAAVGHTFGYHHSLGVGAELNTFLERFYSHSPKQFSPVYFLSAAETDSKLPMMGFIHPELGIIRVLEHPLAKEFTSFIPWIFRDTYGAFNKLIEQKLPTKTLPELYKSIEDIRWVNHKIMRHNFLEEIIVQFNAITVQDFWEAIPIESPLNMWLQEVTRDLIQLKQAKSHRLRLPLPYNQNMVGPIVIFWLQLLESLWVHKSALWRAYWCETSLLFISGPHSPLDVLEILEPDMGYKTDPGSKISFAVDSNMTLMKLLSCWRDALKLQ